MAAFEVIALDTATPQLRAPGASDTYTFPRAVEMPLGTANGVLYLNGSKVVTSGSALTFDGTNLGVPAEVYRTSDTSYLRLSGGNSAGTGANVLMFGSTHATNPNRLSLNAPNATATSYIDFGVAGAEAMRLTSTGLGIGTSSPGAKLDVNGEARASTFSSPTFSINSNPTSGVSTSQSQIRFKTTGADFYVGTESSVGGAFFPGSTAYAAVLYNANSTPMQFYTAGALRATLDASGNLGLGVTPSATGASQKSLEIGGLVGIVANPASNTSSAYAHNAYYNGTNWIYINTSVSAARYEMTGANSPGSTHAWYVAAGGTAGNTISFTQAMTLDASGRLLVGYTSNQDGSALQVNANSVGSALYTAAFNNSSTSTSAYNSVRFSQGAAGSATGYIGTGGSAVGNAAWQNTFVVGTQTSNALVFNTIDTERARIPAAGGMVVGTTALATTATDGFLYVPTCAGTPTGTPTTQTGTAPIVVDTTNNKLYFYSGGQWRDAGP